MAGQIGPNPQDLKLIQSGVKIGKMRASVRLGMACLICLLTLSVGCIEPRNSEDLKEKTARATADAKRDAKAVAQGIREGWSRDKPLDLNTATKDQLMALPGMSAAESNAVIEGRPYHDPQELLSRHILSKAQYYEIADRIKAK